MGDNNKERYGYTGRSGSLILQVCKNEQAPAGVYINAPEARQGRNKFKMPTRIETGVDLKTCRGDDLGKTQMVRKIRLAGHECIAAVTIRADSNIKNYYSQNL